MKAWDKDLELIWFEPGERWVLYRVATRGACRSLDKLIKVCELEGPKGEFRPPGPWLLNWLRTSDLGRRYGTLDHDRATRLFEYELKRRDELKDAQKEADLDEMSQAFAEDVYFCARGRHSGPHDPWQQKRNKTAQKTERRKKAAREVKEKAANSR